MHVPQSWCTDVCRGRAEKFRVEPGRMMPAVEKKPCDGCGKKATNIVKGYTNFTLGRESKLCQERIGVCKTCDRYRMWVCGECGCFVPAKARVPDEKCVLGKWVR
jgi:hypothetical protein